MTDGDGASRALHDMIDRAKRVRLLPGEAALLHEAIDLLDDMKAVIDAMVTGDDDSPGAERRWGDRYDDERGWRL